MTPRTRGTVRLARAEETVEVVTRHPPLICPSCQCAWPGLTTGAEDTVTCSCGRLLGCAMRDR